MCELYAIISNDTKGKRQVNIIAPVYDEMWLKQQFEKHLPQNPY